MAETAAPTTQAAPATTETVIEDEATGGDGNTNEEVSSNLSLEARLQKADQLLAA